MSYQSGGIPTLNTSQAGGLAAVEDAEAQSGHSMWETRYGLRVDMLAAFSYLLGPISGEHRFRETASILAQRRATALLLLIVETHNDYVRFHGMSPMLAVLAGYNVTQRRFISIPISSPIHTPSRAANFGITPAIPIVLMHDTHTHTYTTAPIHDVSEGYLLDCAWLIT